MARENKNGKAETSTSKTAMTLKDVKRHIKTLRNAKEVCGGITALARRPEISAAIDEEITKAKDYAVKLIEKELTDL